MERMIGRTFYKRLRLLNGGSETVTTRFELDEATGQLVEHVTMQTHDGRRGHGPSCACDLCAMVEADPSGDVGSERTPLGLDSLTY
jgi:hypothetical protein